MSSSSALISVFPGDVPAVPPALPSGPRDTLPLRPRPVGLIVIHQPEFDQTIITRNWLEGDPARCHLCPRARCGANGCNTCTVVAPGLVDGESARFYRFPGDW